MMTISGFTLMSRVLGLLRDIIQGAFLGLSGINDAFLAAFRFPNMGRRIFGEGAFNSAFVPLYGQTIEQEDTISADRFASQAFSWLVAILGVLSILIIPGMKWFMAPFVPGFLDGFEEVTASGWGALFQGSTWSWIGGQILNPRGTEEFEYTVFYGQIMFSYLLCMALGAQLSGVLNTHKKFAIAAFAPVLLNILFLLGFSISWFFNLQENLILIAEIQSWCAFAAGWAQMGILLYGVKRQGISIRLMIPKVTPKMKHLGLLMIPGIAAASVQQINLLFATQIGSSKEGVISAIYYADRINQFPLGMIGIGLGVVLLPEISRLIGRNDQSGAQTSFSNGFKIGMLLTIPAAVALFAIPEEIIRVAFERGKWDPQNTITASEALSMFALGLPAYVLIKILSTGYFARKNTKTPMVYAAIMVASNIVLSLILFPRIGHEGLALATSIAGWVNVALLLYGLRDWFSIDQKLLLQLGKIFCASVLMALAVKGASYLCADWLNGGELIRIIALGAIIGLGVTLYAVSSLFLGATTLVELKSYLKRS